MVWMFRAPERSACSSAEAREDSSVRRPCSSLGQGAVQLHIGREQLGDAIGHGDDSRCYLIGKEATTESFSSWRICSF